jgi:hypothetical protein
MKITILGLVTASGLSLAVASQVSAAPADGAAIAHIARQVDPGINVATKKKKTATQSAAAKPPCANDQTRSNRTGNCRPLTSEEK